MAKSVTSSIPSTFAGDKTSWRVGSSSGSLAYRSMDQSTIYTDGQCSIMSSSEIPDSIIEAADRNRTRNGKQRKDTRPKTASAAMMIQWPSEKVRNIVSPVSPLHRRPGHLRNVPISVLLNRHKFQENETIYNLSPSEGRFDVDDSVYKLNTSWITDTSLLEAHSTISESPKGRHQRMRDPKGIK